MAKPVKKVGLGQERRNLIIAVVISLIVGAIGYKTYNDTYAQSRWKVECGKGLAAACEGYVKGAW